jgi:hypothetical protein
MTMNLPLPHPSYTNYYNYNYSQKNTLLAPNLAKLPNWQ